MFFRPKKKGCTYTIDQHVLSCLSTVTIMFLLKKHVDNRINGICRKSGIEIIWKINFTFYIVV